MSVVYVAQPGDSLSRILQRAGGSWLQDDWQNRLMSLNPHIKNPNIIEINQLILVPDHPDEIILQDRVNYVAKTKNAMNDTFLRSEIERFARSKEEAVRKQRFLAKLDRIQGLQDAGIMYFDQYGSPITIREPIGPQKKTLIVRESPAINDSNPVNDRFWNEVISTSLSCGAALLGGIAIFSGGVLVPFSGGASTALSILAYSATAASGAQCGIGLTRILLDANGYSSNVDWVDSQEWYIYTTLALDTISIAGGVGAAATSIKSALLLKKVAPSKSFYEILKGLQRHERKRISEELVKLNIPGISNKAIKQMIKSGMISKRYTQVQITHSMRTQIIDLFGAGASLVGSGLYGMLNRTGRNVSIILFQALD